MPSAHIPVIVKRVDLHGAKIKLESKFGEGTTVTMRAADFEMNTSKNTDFNERSIGNRSPPGNNGCMFQFLFEHTSDAVWLIDPNTGTVADCNKATAVLMRSTSRADLIGRRLKELVTPEQEDDSPIVEAVRSVAERFQSRSIKFDWKARRFDGTEVRLEGNAMAIERNGATVLMLVSREADERKEAERALHRDISKRKLAEDEIRQLNASLEKRVTERTIELLRANDQLKRAEEASRKRSDLMQKHRDVLLELAHSNKSDLERALRRICSISAAILDVARVSYWSVLEDDSGISCEVLYLRNKDDFDQQFKGRRIVFAEYRAYFDELAARRTIVANEVLSHPATRDLGENHLKPLGISSLLDTPVWECGEGVGVLRHEHVGPPRDWSPEEIDFVSALASIVSLALEESNRVRAEHLLRESEAKLRESEARFSTAFRASPALMSISRLSDEKYIEVNDAFVRWYGLYRDNIIGHDTRELGIWLNLEDRAKFWADLNRNGSVRELECHARTGRGAMGTLLLSADIIEINRQPHVIATGVDITHRKQAEVELLRTLAREKELGRLRSHFVSMVSHEFRTPLGIIQSSAEILEDYLEQLEPAERKNHLQSIRNNTCRMARMMEEALLIGSLDAGNIEFKPAPLELRPFVQKLVEEVLSATNRRCPIELLLADIPGQIQANERLLQHILTNLLTNAVKYSDPGRAVRFEIAFAGTEIVCDIRDQGIGIPEADQEWLFSAFHRGQNVADRPGTGLGLVIVKRCVDLYGGKINVESQFGKGTVVTVRLPVFSPGSPAAGGGAD